MQFIDKSKIRIVSGRGGNGMVAWRREKYVDKGGPAGGDGGRGGDVYLVADEGMSTLMDFKYKSVYKAPSGENGGIKNCHGACAKDLYIKVPVGTLVRDIKTGNVIADLTKNEQTVMVAKGGRGGRGNARFATAQKRAPQFCEPGEPGIERELFLELKLIADVGLLGMPNAGKSTLISRISSARPKIADYPFTTLVPNLGVVKKRNGDGYVVADIPGLIEGASEGVGLGYEFLRHVERCRFLVHLVDVTAENPFRNYEIINNELKKHSEALYERYQIVVLNKIDAVDEERLAEIREEFQPHVLKSSPPSPACPAPAGQPATALSNTPLENLANISHREIFSGKEIYEISAVTGEGLDKLLDVMSEKVDEIPHPPSEVNVEEDLGAFDNDDSNFEVFKADKNTFIVQGGKIERLAQVTSDRNPEQVIRLQNIMKGMGIFDELAKRGIKDEDTVIVGHLEFVYFKDEIYG